VKTKLKCLLLDDELPGLTYLKILCEQIPELDIIKAFNDPVQFLKEFQKLDFDLCILDIEMPGLNGLEIANLLRGKLIIFTTAYKEHAAEAFDLDAVDYVSKPIKRERLQQAINKALKRTDKNNSKNFIQLNSDKGKSILFFDHISYITVSEADSRDKTVRMQDGSILVLKNISFEKLIKQLPETQFCQVNKKDLIALKCIQHFTHDEIVTNILLPGGHFIRLTLSENFRYDFLKKINS
jgi:DNA-binding LytR/AlgR family response regulator